MTEFTSHPTKQLLDRLRAELLGSDSRVTEELKQHVRSCHQCQNSLDGWSRLRDVLKPSENEQTQVASRLRTARNTALGFTEAKRSFSIQPLFAMAASVILVVSLAVLQPWVTLDTAPDQIAQGQSDKTPEIYEDPDFYLWLAGHEESMNIGGGWCAFALFHQPLLAIINARSKYFGIVWLRAHSFRCF